MDDIDNTWGLAVDLGTSFISACRFGPRTVTPLEVDGSRRIPSAVLLDREGHLVAGELAVRGGAVDPERVERTPKRAVGRPFVLLGGQTVVVADALAAQLRLITDEGTRQAAGLPPSTLVLTHPARWGSDRRATLTEAAARAGLPVPVLVPEPVAAASRYLNDRPIGTTVAVYDLGGGTFDTAVVRAEPDGPTVLGEPGGEDDLGGETFDHALFRLVLEHLEDREPGITEPLLESPERRWQRAASDLLDEVRRAKEALSTHLRTSVYFAMLDAEVEVTRGELDDLIRADVDTTVRELSRTITAAGLRPDEVDVIHLVGGSSRIPLVARQLRARFGDLLQTYDDPKYVVVDGAAALMRAEIAESRVSSPKPAPEPALPPGGPVPAGDPRPPDELSSDELSLGELSSDDQSLGGRVVGGQAAGGGPLGQPVRASSARARASGLIRTPGRARAAVTAAAAVAAVAFGTTLVASGADLTPWSADPSSSPPVSERTPTPDETSPTDPPSDPPNPPSYSAPIGGDQADNTDELYDWLAEHEDELVHLELEIDVDEDDVVFDESEPHVFIELDCVEPVVSLDSPCDVIDEHWLTLKGDSAGETGLDSAPWVLSGDYVVGAVSEGSSGPFACNVSCAPPTKYRSVSLEHQRHP